MPPNNPCSPRSAPHGTVDAGRRAYERLGFETIPLFPGSKQPIEKGWKQPSRDVWQRALRDSNLGILTGEPSGGLAVLDIDEPGNPGELSRLGLRGLLDATMVVATARGYHIYVLVPDMPTFRLDAIPGDPHFPGDVDIIGDGGMVVAPPSIHPTGTRYELLSSPRRPAPLDALHLHPAFRNAMDERTGRWGRQPPPCVGAGASRELLRRAEAFVDTQSPKFQTLVARLRMDELPDRSAAEYALALGLAETGFEFEEIANVLKAWGPKAASREDAYLTRTVAKAMQRAKRTRT